MPCSSTTSQRAWTRDRVARLGFLVGQGIDVDRVARDPGVATSPGNVRRQVNRFGLALRDAPLRRRLPAAVEACLDAAATRRGLTRERLIRKLVLAAASEASLLANILDDDV